MVLLTSLPFEYHGYRLARRKGTSSLYVHWTPPGARDQRRSLGTSNVEAAKDLLIKFADARRVPTRPHASEVLLEPVLHRYANTQLSGKSQDDAQRAIRILQAFINGAAISTVEEMTPAMQRQFIDWRRQQGWKKGIDYSNGTINKPLEVLKAALNHAKREGFVHDVPHVQFLPKPPPRDRFLSVDEVGRLLKECRDPHLFVFTMIGLHTLQRPQAILDLRIEQIDFNRRRIDFRSAAWTPNATKRRPVVPISNTLLPVLREAASRSTSGHLVELHGRPVASIKKGFRAACRRAGVENASPYTLRHSGATLLAAAGVPLWQISGMLGHGIARTTELYAKHAPDFLTAATDGLDRVLGGLSGPAPAKLPPEAWHSGNRQSE